MDRGRRRAFERQDQAPLAQRPGRAPGDEPPDRPRFDREDSIEKFIYGRGGVATASFVNEPKQFKSTKLKYEFNIEKANKILDDAGWKKGADGIREKDGKKLKYVFQTSINAPRQKTQAIIKQACQRAGIELELKSVTASVYFSSDVANPDTYTKLYCDMEMYTTRRSRSPIRSASSTSSSPGRSPARRTSGWAATSRATRTRKPTRPTRPPRRSSTRSSAPRC